MGLTKRKYGIVIGELEETNPESGSESGSDQFNFPLLPNRLHMYICI